MNEGVLNDTCQEQRLTAIASTAIYWYCHRICLRPMAWIRELHDKWRFRALFLEIIRLRPNLFYNLLLKFTFAAQRSETWQDININIMVTINHIKDEQTGYVSVSVNLKREAVISTNLFYLASELRK